MSENIAVPAELVITNAVIYTVDKDRTSAEALAVSGGRIAAVGSADEIKKYIGTETELIDMGGKLVLPAFVDSHMHPASSAVVYVFQIKLHDLFTNEDYLERISDFVKKNPKRNSYNG